MLAGVFTTTIMAPGERIKCLLQVRIVGILFKGLFSDSSNIWQGLWVYCLKWYSVIRAVSFNYKFVDVNNIDFQNISSFNLHNCLFRLWMLTLD